NSAMGGGARPYGDETASLIDAEVARIIHEGHEDAKRLLREHRPSLDALVAALMERETLNEEEILEVTGLPPAPALRDLPLERKTSETESPPTASPPSPS